MWKVPQRFQGVLKVPRWCGDGLTCQLWECASEALKDTVLTILSGIEAWVRNSSFPKKGDPSIDPKIM